MPGARTVPVRQGRYRWHGMYGRSHTSKKMNAMAVIGVVYDGSMVEKPEKRLSTSSENHPIRPIWNEAKMKSMAVIGMVYGIDYCLLDSLFYTPSTFYDPSVHRSISQSLRLDAWILSVESC